MAMVAVFRRTLTTLLLGGLGYFQPILILGLLALTTLALILVGWALLGPHESPTNRIVRVIEAVGRLRTLDNRRYR
jgi:hypothetical protein